MSDDVCKHGWSRRFCEPCSQAQIIASLKGPRDKGMLATPPDELRDNAVLRYLLNRHAYRDMVDAAIALALEEAAQVCERRFMGDHNREDMEARRCAAAIRAMIPKENT